MSAEQANQQICFLCDKVLLPESKRTVKERAIRSFINASLKRKDRKHKYLQTVRTLDIHKNCSTCYARERNIAAALKAAKKISFRKRMLNKHAKIFNFTVNCFFCGLDARFQSNDKMNKRIQFVKSEKTRQNILDELADRKAKGQEQNDDFKALYKRLTNVDDLIQANARYHKGCMTHFYSLPRNVTNGRPVGENTTTIVQHIVESIYEKQEECQFSLKEILSSFDGEIPRKSRIKSSLEDYFGDKIAMYSVKKDAILCFSDAVNTVLDDAWYEARAKNKQEDRNRIVETAANIILQDIQTSLYDRENCDPASVADDVPESLKLFLDVLIKSHKKKDAPETTGQKWLNRIVTFGHMLISSVRPQSFLSSILMGLTSMMGREKTPNSVIDSLSDLGLCAEKETLLSDASNPERFVLSDDPIWKNVFGNANHEMETVIKTAEKTTDDQVNN